MDLSSFYLWTCSVALLQDPTRVQPFLRKIFEGINGLEFQPNTEVTAMISEEGEKVCVQGGCASSL